MVNIPDIKRELLFPRQRVAAIYLGPAGDAGVYVVAAGLFGRIERQVFHSQRSWADEAHFALEDIPEFGEFVEAGFAEECTEGRETLGIRQEVAVGVTCISHGAELHQLKRLAMQPGALLPEEDRGAQLAAHEQGEDCKQGGEQQQPEGGSAKIEAAFAGGAVEAVCS